MKAPKIIIFLLGAIVGIILLIFYPPAKTKAANCGGVTPCVCGDTVTSNYTLSSDLNCPATNGLIIGASGITINGNGHSIIGTDILNDGITNGAGGWDNITIINFNKISGFDYGIYLLNSDSPIIQNNVSEENFYNLRLESSPSANISGNTLGKSTGLGSCDMFLSSSNSAIISANNFNQNHNGLRISNANSGTISNNTFIYQQKAISLEGTSTGNNVSNNTIRTSAVAFYLSASTNTISNNKVYNSNEDLTGSGTNTISSNQFLHSAKPKMISFTEQTRTRNVGESISYNIFMLNATGAACADCAYSISTSPTEPIAINKSSNNLTGNFAPGLSGIYTLNVTVTDTNNNLSKRNYIFFTGSLETVTTRFYLRGTNPVHGQPSGNDAKSLIFSLPTKTEEWTCGAWIQNSPDIIPNYPLANLTAVDTNTWYTLNTSGVLGIERFVTYSTTRDVSLTVPSAVSYAFINRNLTGFNWSIDYPWHWYWLALKLRANGDPHWRSTPAETSYADFTYSYPSALALFNISNDNLIIKSAVKKSDNANFSLTLENPLLSSQNTDLNFSNLNHPFLGITNQILSAGNDSFSVNLSASQTRTLETVNLAVTPNTGSIDLTIDTWQTSGNYYKKWTEDGSASNIITSHTIGELKAITDYTVYVDGNYFGSFQSNNSGEISFTYYGGYSAKTFEVKESPSSEITNILPETGS
ncbi:MAG: right-handed parallel beta-helix repeat-containing protein [Candidatus Berkelbacteria bacterium]|nr:right-handed parallel beta-helix repeat-containing protein [Candidatus Berkelbacteria bacterium]